MKTIRFALFSIVALLLAAPAAWATANYVYHERSPNDIGTGQPYVSPLAPNYTESETIRFKVEYQFYTNQVRLYYTTDGSAPSGEFGVGSGSTQVVAASYEGTFGSPVVDVAKAIIPAQSAGTTVKYIVSAWHTGGGSEIFANSGEFSSPFTTSAQATVFSYTVSGVAPSVTTTAATNVAAGGATLNASVNPGGLATTVTFHLDGNAIGMTNVAAGTSTVTTSFDVSGLAPASHHTFYASASNSAGMNTGATLDLNTTISYTLIDLNGSAAITVAQGLNNHGQVVGKIYPGGGDPNYHGFVWSAGTVTTLGDFGGGKSEARSINDLGQVVGHAFYAAPANTYHAFLYSGGTLTDLGTIAGGNSGANDINDAGQITGFSGGDYVNEDTAFLYSGGTMQDLGTLGNATGTAINNAGQVAGNGSGYDPSGRRGWIYSGGVKTVITPQTAGANAINDAGDVVGTYYNSSTGEHAYLYSGGVLGDFFHVGNGVGINNAGQMLAVNYNVSPGKLTLISGGSSYDVLDLLTNGSGVTDMYAGGAKTINDWGQIACTGVFGGPQHALLLSPTTPFFTTTGNSRDTKFVAGMDYGLFTPLARSGGSTAKLRGGTAAANREVVVGLADRSTQAAPPSGFYSDIADITGSQTDTVVIQLSYDVSAPGTPVLATFTGTQWVNAVALNTGGSAAFVSGAFDGNATLGRYGLDTTNHVAWAVVNHNSLFAVTGALPFYVVTDPVTDITTTTATLHATVNPAGLETTVTFYEGFSQVGTPVVVPAGTADVTVNVPASGYVPGTMHTVYAYASNSGGTATGDDVSFTLLGGAPSITTLEETDVTTTSATMRAQVNPNMVDTTVDFYYDGNFVGSEVVPANSGTVTVTRGVSGQTPGTTHTIEAYATNLAGQIDGGSVSVTYLGGVPSITTLAPTDVTTTSATLRAQVNPSLVNTMVDFYLSGSFVGSASVGANDGTVIKTLPISGQTPGSTHTVEAYATNLAGSISGGTLPLTFLAPGAADDLNANIVGSYVTAIAVQPDEKIIIGGDFSSVQGVARTNIARLNADGTLDTSFVPAVPDGPVYALALQTDGKIYVGGPINNFNGASRVGFARLNADGSLDTSFTLRANSIVNSFAIQPDGNVLVAGQFHALHETEGGPQILRNRIARFSPGGIVDTTFNPNAGNIVFSVALQGDGKILLAGDFTTIGAATRNYIARVFPNGSLDTGFDPNVNPGGRVNAMLVQADGNIVIAGNFSSLDPNAGGSPVARNRIARVSPGGFVDATFDPNVDQPVLTLALQADGKILLGGHFTTVAATPRNFIARVNSDGTLDSFDPSSDGITRALALQADGRVLAGGVFGNLYLNGSPTPTVRNRFARLANEDGVQTLSAPDSTELLWLRNGTTSELAHVAFELSTNGGTTWMPLGPGERLGPASWHLTGLSLPNNCLVRARGRTTGGYYNGSGGLIEEVLAIVEPAQFTDWMTIGPGSRVNGTVETGAGSVSVTFDGDNTGAVVDGTSTTFNRPETFTPPLATSDLITTFGTVGIHNKITFGQSLRGVVMHWWSLGNPSMPVRLTFTKDGATTPASFQIVSSGPNEYTSSGVFVQEGAGNNVLHGEEGSGTIHFDGTLTTLEWDSDATEVFFAFQVGVDVGLQGVITDSFTLNGGTRVAGVSLNGLQTETGGVTWEGRNAFTFTADGTIVMPLPTPPAGGIETRIMSVPFVPAASLTVSVQADIQPPHLNNEGPDVFGSLGFCLNPTPTGDPTPGHPYYDLGFYNTDPMGRGLGQLWAYLGKDGSWSLRANANAIVLASGSAPNFEPTSFNRMRITYDTVANTAALSINGTNVATGVSLGAFTPTIEHAGFFFHRLDGAAVDNFAVQSVVPPMDTETEAPTLIAPAENGGDNTPIAVSYTLPEAAQAGSVVLTFHSGGTLVNLTVGTAGESAGTHNYSIDVANPGASFGIVSATGGAIVEGIYNVAVSYQDAEGNAVNFDVNSNVTIDTTAPTGGTFTATPPGPIPEGTPVDFAAAGWSDTYGSLSYQFFDGAVSLGPPQAGSTLSGVLLAAGAHDLFAEVSDAAGNTVMLGPVSLTVTVASLSYDLLALKGGAVPGAGIDPSIPVGATWSFLGLPAINDAGAVAFFGKWKSATTGTSGSGIFVNDTLVVAGGSAAPGVSGATFKMLKEPLLAESGRVAFLATLAGSGIISANDAGAWADFGSGPVLVARESAEPPGVAGAQWKAIKSVAFQDGAVAVLATMILGVGNVTSADDLGLWMDTGSGPVLALREGQSFEGTTVKSFTAISARTGATGQGHGIADDGASLSLVALASLADGRKAWFSLRSTGG